MENTKSKDKALLLAFFLGMFGAHRFYINKKITASIQLLITIIFGFLYFSDFIFINILWVFIDLILILFKRFKVNWI